MLFQARNFAGLKTYLGFFPNRFQTSNKFLSARFQFDKFLSWLGMTNRKDMIDDALLRPGRLEVQVEIGLPKEDGRLEILNIHTGTMRKNEKLAADVDLLELSKVTKNFSGAEIEGLVRAAQSCALNRLVRASSKVSELLYSRIRV